MDHLVTEFSFGSMPHHLAEMNMRLFAERVMPVLQRMRRFRGLSTRRPRRHRRGDDRLFAPA